MSAVRALRIACVRPLAALLRAAPDADVIDVDVARWLERNHRAPASTARALSQLLTDYPEFRNLYYYRLSTGHAPRALRLAVQIARRVWAPMPTLDLSCDEIGPGLTLAHGHGTVLTAASIGAGCWIHHQVTIGWDYKTAGRPRIGNDVFIGAGAKILGDVTVGDGARIGANAVVVTDVPAGATAVGVPARILGPRTDRVSPAATPGSAPVAPDDRGTPEG